MGSFGFRLRFLFEKGRRLNYDGKSLKIQLSETGPSVILKSAIGKKISETENLAVFGSGFHSEGKAKECGVRLKGALLVIGAKLQRGIDTGEDEVVMGLGKDVKKKAKEQGFNVLDDIHGLCTFSEQLPVKVLSGFPPSLIVSSSEKIFVDELITVYGVNPSLSEKQILALDLYNLSRFESSLRARFVTLITAVEALSTRGKRTEPELAYLNILIELTKRTDLDSSQKKSLLESLTNLKQEGIAKACRKLVESRLNNVAVKSFQDYYEIRSKILHSGKTPEGVSLGSVTKGLDKLVSDLLVKDTLSE